MKHIQKSEEPIKLQEYRRANPDGKWENFRNECQSGLNEVYKTLSGDQGGLCVYCEIKVTALNRQVEHFHDKTIDADLLHPVNPHLDWNNMWYCCRGGTNESSDKTEYLEPIKENLSCGQHKKTETSDYQNMISPQEIPAFPRIFRYEYEANGISIHADETLCSIAKIDKEKVERTITILNLNCKRLCVARYAVLKAINKTLNEKHPNSDQFKKLVTRFIGNKYENRLWNPFFTMIRWRFKNIAEEYLYEIQFDS
ncbi:MAG: TIGR02646 family protein [Planctomycetaceae bacterium]|jgi:uncharacterized protein (TIGR02646 family)|nr:TIGR02646 family protein [Planctomycetaceae bacterium]